MRTRLIVIALALLGLLSLPAVANAAYVDFFVWNATQESILSEMTTHPAAIEVDGIIYIAYQSQTFDSYIVSWDSTTDEWDGPYRIGISTIGADAHGAPALFVDDTGRIHALFGAHNSPLKHSQTRLPGSIRSWEALADVAPQATYPQISRMSDGRMVLFNRSSLANWVIRESEPDETTFGSEQIVLAGESDAWWYANSRLIDDKLLVAFARVDPYEYRTGDFSRHDIFFAQRLPDGTWTNAAGAPLETPLTRESAEASCVVFDSGYGLTNEVTGGADTSGTPCAMYVTGRTSGADRFTWKFDRWDGTQWRSAEVTTTDHHFDSGSFRSLGPGRFEAVLVAGSSNANLSPAGDMRGRGGTIYRFTSEDSGATWSVADDSVSPTEPGSYFSNPVFVDGGSTGASRVVFTDWSNDITDHFRRLFLWSDGSLVPREVTPGITRLPGANRVATAVSISREAFPMSASTIVLATATDFPDALTGAPLAAAERAPLLLTAPDRLSSEVSEEIRRLQPTTAIVLGGHAAISANVEDDLKALGIRTVDRVWGASRFETALAVSRRLYAGPNSTHVAAVVSGRSWPDACVTGPLAAGLACPIILTDGSSLPSASRQIIDEWHIWSTIVVGGAGVVPDSVTTVLPSPMRIGGANRFETSAMVARYACEVQLLPHRFVLASGRTFPDALASSTLAARIRGPILLTDPQSLPVPVAEYVDEVADEVVSAYVAGGTNAVSDATIEDLDRRLNPK